MAKTILLDDGSGGRASQRLINEVFLGNFDNEILRRMDDAASLPAAGARLAVSVDGFTVSPIFFPGGDIGELAVYGTVNDVSMAGAKPVYLTAAFIIEEGMPLADLEAIARSMAAACSRSGVQIVTGDTKVVPKGACDQIFITTTGMGEIYADPQPGGKSAKPDDAILVSGSIGDHGLAVMAARNDLGFLSDAVSDCAPLNHMVEALIRETGDIHVVRDPTRGGLATTLNEIAEQSGVCMEVEEAAIPVTASVREGCGLLGLDPLYLANEGKLVCILPLEKAQAALAVMRRFEEGQKAALIGKVTQRRPGQVIIQTRMGGERFAGMLEGMPLPRIC